MKLEVMIDGELTPSPRVVDFPSASPEDCDRITDLETIQIEFSYPLSNTVKRLFTHPGGFNAYDMFKAIYDGYTTIYQEEDAAVHVQGMLNRIRCHGPHGIWGHDIDDLYIEGVHETTSGCYSLEIGS